MIGFFPDPYPDELLYSVCARYSQRVRYVNKKFVTEEMFGRKEFSAIVDFPVHIGALLKFLSTNSYTDEGLINNNTLLPFFEPFLPKHRATIVREEMTYSKVNNVTARLGIRVRQLYQPEYLRFCPVCVETDRELYGETFWHRLHQLTGILVCPLHFCFLENSRLRWGRESSDSFKSAEDFIDQNEPRYVDVTNKDHEILLKISGDAEWLLSQKKLGLNSEILRQRYFNSLLQERFAYYNGSIRHNEFIRACQEVFSPKLYSLLGRVSERENWLSTLIRMTKAGVIYHPIRHLLLITFLGLTVEEFFTSFTEFKPFGNPPYPCLNRASSHYGEMRIKKCEVFDNLSKDRKKKGCPVGYFSCDCGFTYQRIGPDRSEKDKFTYSSVREYGELWEIRLAELWKNLNLSVSEIGNHLGVSSHLISRHAIRLSLPMNKDNTRTLQGYHRYRKPSKSYSQMRQNYRNNWLEVIKNNSNLTRRELANKTSFLYLWLKKNDSEWFEQHLPTINKSRRRGRTQDWEKIDEKLSEAVKRVCDEIVAVETFPIRASITEIIRRVENKKWIEKRKLKLPLTNQIIDERLESLEDYMIRKVSWAEESFFKEKKLPTRLQLKIRAVVRNKISESSNKVQCAIDAALDNLRIKLKIC